MLHSKNWTNGNPSKQKAFRQEELIKNKLMEQYEITSLNRGMEYTEYIKSNNIMDAINQYYSNFGYQKILKIEISK